MATFDKTLKQLVWERDAGRCWRCAEAVWVGDIHHRRARGMGGRDGHEEWINDHSNLLTLHRKCHDWIEANPVEAGRYGWMLTAGQVPTEVSVYNAGDAVWYRLHGQDFKTPTSAGPPPVW